MSSNNHWNWDLYTSQTWTYSEVVITESRQGIEQTRTFDPTNESADCWSAANSYNFINRVISMQQIKSILIGWKETSCLYLSFNKVSWQTDTHTDIRSP